LPKLSSVPAGIAAGSIVIVGLATGPLPCGAGSEDTTCAGFRDSYAEPLAGPDSMVVGIK
jgi:hypothetical protein